MAGADEKRVHHLAERKGFRLDKVGKGQHRFYLTDVGSGAKMPADVPGHDYSFTLEAGPVPSLPPKRPQPTIQPSIPLADSTIGQAVPFEGVAQAATMQCVRH